MTVQPAIFGTFHTDKIPITVEWLALLSHIHEVTGLILRLEGSCPDLNFLHFPLVSPGRQMLEHGCYNFFPHCSHFIIHSHPSI